ncbi:cytochrome-c oxidase, cbb3-type subunit III [Methylibium sp. Pch-M]|uniref:cytochrome-c oxidase, cbb3-type subunit III n=1 Tax=Methylibium sp. Pch-M TaxID=2082386 RepID=UPI0010104812|nr:cytochrome-c oxidase, cbb3-type subunit III [Methylibium sp. Pch-M]QAZ40795.1 cytochrome-c oxidase, cbb3-type subunit III [Methylibium sp. Pch-M]
MSDFVAVGWPLFIAIVTIAGLAACLVLLFIASRRKVMAGDNTTGHVWDEDLRELNNPLPLWWMGLFVLTVLFGALYLVLYPGLGTNPGQLRWTSQTEYEAEMARGRAQVEPLYERFTAMSAADLARDPQARALGERLFINNCAQCHGSDARGSKGFPNLTDADWLHGGSPEQIAQSIAQGRQGMMPPMAAAVGSADDVRNVANYVLSLSGSPHDSIAAQIGRTKFTACAACHGPGGKGNPALGAPNLSDRIWLHGWGEEAVVRMINEGKTNLMPAHAGRLSDAQIQVLAAYVWGLSNSGATTTAAAK